MFIFTDQSTFSCINAIPVALMCKSFTHRLAGGNNAQPREAVEADMSRLAQEKVGNRGIETICKQMGLVRLVAVNQVGQNPCACIVLYFSLEIQRGNRPFGPPIPH